MGRGGLNILPHKSWNVYSRRNVEKVRRDEDTAKVMNESRPSEVCTTISQPTHINLFEPDLRPASRVSETSVPLVNTKTFAASSTIPWYGRSLNKSTSRVDRPSLKPKFISSHSDDPLVALKARLRSEKKSIERGSRSRKAHPNKNSRKLSQRGSPC